MGDEVLDGWRWFMGHFDYAQCRDGVLDWWRNAGPAHQRKVSGKNFCL